MAAGSTDLAVLGLEVRSDGVAVASNRLDELQKQSERAEKATNKLRSEISNSERATDRFKQELIGAEQASGRFQKEIQRANDTLSNTSGIVSEVTSALQAMGVALTVAFVFKTLTDYEQGMASVRAITRATGAEFEDLRNRAKQLGASTRYTAGEAAESMKLLAQAGFTVNEVLTASTDVLAMAQAGNIGLAEAADISAKALRGFRLETDQMTRVADLLATAANVSNTNISAFGEAFPYAGPVAAALGVSIEDTTAAIAALSDSGISASMAGTALRGIMMRVQAPTKQATKLLHEAGLTLDDVDIKAKGLLPVLQRLSEADLGEKAFTIFGQRAGPAFEVLQTAIPKLKELGVQFQNTAGYAAETARIMDDNLKGASLNFISSIEDAIISTSDALGVTKGLTNALTVLADVLRTITQLGVAGWAETAVVAFGLYIASTKAVALWTGAATGAMSQHVLLIQMVAARYGIASAASMVFTNTLIALRTALITIATNPVFWIVAFGTAIYSLVDYAKSGQREIDNLSQAFREAANAAEDSSKQIKEAAETKAQVALTAATEQLDADNKKLAELLAKIQDQTSFDVGGFDVGTKIIERIESVGEKIFGTKQATFDATNIIQELGKAQQAASTYAEKLGFVNTTLEKLRKLRETDPSADSVGKAIKLTEAYAKTLMDAHESSEKLNEVRDRLNGVKESSQAVVTTLKELDDLMKHISGGKQIEVALNYTEAAEALDKWTKNTMLARQEQFALGKATAEANLVLIYQAHAVALLAGRFEDAKKIFAEIVGYQAKMAQVTMKGSDAEERKAEKQAKFQQAAIDKVVELNLRLVQIQAEVTGAGKEELEVYKLHVEKAKELNDLREKAAEAGKMGASAELAQAVALVEQIYTLKESTAAYAAQWSAVLIPLQHAVDLANAQGMGVEEATRALKEQELLMKQQDPNLDRAVKVREVAVIEAELAELARNTQQATLQANAEYAERVGLFQAAYDYQSQLLQIEIDQLELARGTAKYTETKLMYEAQILAKKQEQRELDAYAKGDIAELLSLGMTSMVADSSREFLDIWRKDIPDALKSTSGTIADLGMNLVDTSKSATDSWKEFQESMYDILNSITKQLLQATIQAALFGDSLNKAGGSGSGFGGILGSAIGSLSSYFAGTTMATGTQMTQASSMVNYAGSFAKQHTGGLVGQNNSGYSRVAASEFASAVRYHNGGIAGLKSNEVATILEMDEEVITTKDPRHRFNQLKNNASGGGPAINVTPKVTTNVVIESPPEYQAQQQSTSNSEGGTDIRVTFSRMMAAETNTYGSPANNALRAGGFRRQPTRSGG